MRLRALLVAATPLASLMVSQGVMEGGTVNVTLKGGEPSFEVKKRTSRVKKSEAKEAASLA